MKSRISLWRSLRPRARRRKWHLNLQKGRPRLRLRRNRRKQQPQKRKLSDRLRLQRLKKIQKTARWRILLGIGSFSKAIQTSRRHFKQADEHAGRRKKLDVPGEVPLNLCQGTQIPRSRSQGGPLRLPHHLHILHLDPLQHPTKITIREPAYPSWGRTADLTRFLPMENTNRAVEAPP